MDKVPMTAEGYAALEAEIKYLKTVERPRIIKQIADARTHGDLSENAEYHAAKEQQGSPRRASPTLRTSFRAPTSSTSPSSRATR